MDAKIQSSTKRKASGKLPVNPKAMVRGAKSLELRAAIAAVKAEATRDLERIEYTQRPRGPKEAAAKIWKRAPVSPKCCRVRQSPTNKKDGHKPKQTSGRKLTDIAASLPKPSAAIPMLFHLLRRFVDSQEPANKFEEYVFRHLARLQSEELDSLVGGLKQFESVKEPYRSALFDDRFDHWSPKQPVGSSLMHWTLLDDSITLKWGRGLDTLLLPAKIRPWNRVVGVGDFQVSTAPWPWINDVEGLRTVDHIQPISFYFPHEYEHAQSWTVDPNTGQPLLKSEISHFPACSVAPHQDKQANCLRVAEVRVGGSVTLTGFNYFSKSPIVNLTRFDGNIMGETFVVEGFVMPDQDTPLKDDKGNIIADHHVTDKLMFDIPTMTPDGLYEFPPGIYAVSVTMPNDVQYTSADGSQATEFTSNTAYLRVIPSGNEKYRVWSDQAHCYDPTDGEWGSDELAVAALTATIDAATNTPVVSAHSVFRWGDVDDGESTSYEWNLLGSPNQPESINGFFAMGLLGWEVDSEDSLDDNVRGFGAAFTQYWNLVWEGVVAVGGVGAAIGIVTTLFAGAAWWVAIVVVAVILAVMTIIGIIWAAWAPPDRIIVDLVSLSETQFYYLTSPIGVLPPPHQLAAIPEVQIAVTPEEKVAYLYTEERRYDCDDEGSSYGFLFKYERDA